MKNLKIGLFSLLISFLSLSGCKTYTCSNVQIVLAYVGFSLSDIDTLIFKQYEPNSNFSILKDSFVVRDPPTTGGAGGGIYKTINDTIFVTVNDPNIGVYYGSDWRVYVPSLNNSTSFSNISIQQSGPEKKACYNPITSFTQNGVINNNPSLYQTDFSSTSGYRAYIYP